MNIKIQVKRPDGISNTIQGKLVPAMKPSTPVRRPQAGNQIDRFTIYRQQHDDRFGGKGEDTFNVSITLPVCNKESGIYQRAELVFEKRRFGDAQIISQPRPGCTRCQPLKVQWYHEPTGNVDYQLVVYRRVIKGVCSNRVRR